MTRHPKTFLAGVGVALVLVATSCASGEPYGTTTSTLPIATTTTVLATTTTAEVTAAPEASSDRAPEVEVEESLEDVLEGLIADTDLPSLGVTVFNSDGIIETAVIGVRRVGDPTPVELDDKFSIGSNAKAMTATLVATLVDEGVISWDSTLQDVFGGGTVESLHPEYAKVTVRQLLNHTAGLNDEVDLDLVLREVDVDLSLKAQRAAAAESILTQPPSHPTGEFLYSNVGYTLAGAIVEDITGSSWEDAMQERIFDPLGMESCGFYAPGTPGMLDQPWGHFTFLDNRAMDPGHPLADLPHVIAPAGLVHCNMADWATFLGSQLRGFRGSTTEMISTEAFAAIQMPSPGSNYALGWMIVDGVGGEVLAHTGSNNRFTTEAALIPEADWGVLVVTNIGIDVSSHTMSLALDAMFRHHIAPGSNR